MEIICWKNRLSSATFRQVVYGLIASSTSIASGGVLGFSAVAEKPMKLVDGFSDDHISWFASISTLVTPIGCLLCALLLDRIGRRPSLYVIAIPHVIGWSLLASIPHSDGKIINDLILVQLYLGRIFTGLATGFASVPAAVYLAECTKASLRSALVTWSSLGIALGILLVYCFGAIFEVNWRLVAGLTGILPIISCILVVIFLPESPVWLLSKGNSERAKISFSKLRGVSSSESLPLEVQNEFNLIEESVSLKGKLLENEKESFLQMAKSPEVYRPLFLMITLFAFQQLTGVYVVVAYAVDMFSLAKVDVLDPYIATVIMGLIQFIAGIVVAWMLNRFGRRPMMLTSAIGMTLSMLMYALYLQFESNNPSEALQSVPQIAVFAFVIFGVIGFHNLPWSMIGEVYPTRVKGPCSGITTCCAYLLSFVAIKVYPSIRDDLPSTSGVFYIFTIISAISIIVVWYYMPETHGKTLYEIEAMFRNNNRNSASSSTLPLENKIMSNHI